MLLSLSAGGSFCRVRHRLSLIEPTPLQREADAASKCVSSSLRNAKVAVKRRPPTCSHRFNYGFGTARWFSLSLKKASEPPAVAGGCHLGRRHRTKVQPSATADGSDMVRGLRLLSIFHSHLPFTIITT